MTAGPTVRPRGVALILLILWGGIGSAVPSHSAATGGPPAPVDGALESTPWFDAETESLRPVRVRTIRDDSANRGSRWLPTAKPIPAAPAAGGSAPTAAGGSGLFGSGLTLGNLIGWAVLAIMLVTVVGILVFVFSKTELDPLTGPAKGAAGTITDEQTIERMKHLPPELRRGGVNLREEAERLMRLGDFDQAIILLFGHQLLTLDRAGRLRLARGKTNGRYLREVGATDFELADRLGMTVRAFERSYFGRHPLGEADFRALWESNLDIERSVRGPGEAAA